MTLDVVEQDHDNDCLPPVIPERWTVMKRYALAFAALIALGAGEIATAQAQQFEVGPGGVYVGRDRYDGYDRRERYRGGYNRYEGGNSCGMWRQQCAVNWGTGHMFDVCMQRRAALVACGRY
jgi:hypothetical protein